MGETRSIEKIIHRFVQHVTWLRNLDRILDELFQNPAAQEIMERTAYDFMLTMNILTHNSLINGLSRITESAETFGHRNLTVEHVVGIVCWTEGRGVDARELAERCRSYNRQLKEGRNKIGAHNDLETTLTDRTYPLQENLGKQVIEQLECLVPLAFEQLGLGDGRVVLDLPGDVFDFRKALGDSLLYDRTLADERLPSDLRMDMLRWRLDLKHGMDSRQSEIAQP